MATVFIPVKLKLFRSGRQYAAFAVTLLSALYLTWIVWQGGLSNFWQARPNKPLPVIYFSVLLRPTWICLGIFTLWGLVFTTSVFRFVQKRNGHESFTSGVLLAISCGLLFFGGIAGLWGFWHLDSTEFDTKVYHATVSVDESLRSTYLLCECDHSGLFCKCRQVYFASGGGNMDFVIDTAAQVMRLQFQDRWGSKTIYTLSVSGKEWCEQEVFCN